MDVKQLREDARAGRVGIDRLIDLIEALARELEKANRRIAELEKNQGGPPTPRLDESYSVNAEERRKARAKKKQKRKSKRRGRIDSVAKLAQAERTCPVYPAGVPREACKLSHTRPVWRIENGRAVLVAYEIYRGPGSKYGKIPGALGRSEFGIEIVLSIAYLVFVVGLSYDKVRQLLGFFQNLSLRKSQIDALLGRLARHWEGEFEVLCELLANSAIVHADETSWRPCSVWAFVSEKVRLLLFGVHKDAATLHAMLDPDSFTGTIISDDAAVYGNFTCAQKCWAHLLRKAIRLTLLDPNRKLYRRFADRLLEIYRQACRIQQDRRLGDKGRTRKVAELRHAILELCGTKTFPSRTEGIEHEFRLLVGELLRLFWADELFHFVTAAPATKPNGEAMPVPGTNNESERTLRAVANARKAGRTNKTARGARRQTVITSVLESLRQHLSTFTLASILEEISRWRHDGRSCFVWLRDRLRVDGERTQPFVASTGPPILGRLFPAPA